MAYFQTDDLWFNNSAYPTRRFRIAGKVTTDAKTYPLTKKGLARAREDEGVQENEALHCETVIDLRSVDG